MRKAKPVIGVTGPDEGGTAAWLFTKFGVWLQGGKAVHITTRKKYPVEELDGLILGGGADVDPKRYGQKRQESADREDKIQSGLKRSLIRVVTLVLYPFVYLVRKFFAVSSAGMDKERDELELYYLEKALEQNIPILGVCRGAQLINVKLGGTLHQDITGFYSEIPRTHSILPKKRVRTDLQSSLGKIMDSPELLVNGLHRQAVDKLAPALNVVAKEDNGIIQAVEQPEHPFLIGVQWHPEYMPQIKSQRNIFKALVNAARFAKEKGMIDAS